MNAILVIFFLFIPIGIGVLVIFLLRRQYARGRENLAKTVEELGLRQVKTHVLEGEVENRTYQATFSAGTKNRPPGVQVDMATSVAASISIAKKNKLHRWAEKIGLTKDLRTADLGFDEGFFISSEERSLTRTWLGSEKVRALIAEVFKGPEAVSTFTVRKGKLQILFSPVRWTKNPMTDFISRASQQMARVVTSLEESFGSRLPRRGVQRLHPMLPIVVGIVGLTVGITLAVLAPMKYPPLHQALYFRYLPAALLVFLPFMFLSYRICQDRFQAISFFLSQTALVLAACGLLFSFGPVFLNGYLDQGSFVQRDYQVIAKKRTSKKHGYRYHLKLTSPLDEQGSVKLPCSKKVHRKIRPGQSRVRITFKRGYLKHEWRVRWVYWP